MSWELGWVQKAILAILQRQPDVVVTHDTLVPEVFGPEWTPVQRQQVFNACRSLARRGLVVLNPPSVTEYGQPDMRARVKLAA